MTNLRQTQVSVPDPPPHFHRGRTKGRHLKHFRIKCYFLFLVQVFFSMPPPKPRNAPLKDSVVAYLTLKAHFAIADNYPNNWSTSSSSVPEGNSSPGVIEDSTQVQMLVAFEKSVKNIQHTLFVFICKGFNLTFKPTFAQRTVRAEVPTTALT